ncbi:MAG: nitroreductase [Myxococcota bacterium]
MLWAAMHVYDALIQRRTVHAYDPREVPADVLERALEAARWAPNHKLTNPWRFYLMGEKTKAQVAEVAADLAGATARQSGADEERVAMVSDVGRQKILTSPVLIAVSSRRVPDDAFREREDYAATACAIQNIQLSLWADGVGAKWSTGAVTRDARVYPIVGADPESEELVGFVKAGYPAKVPQVRRKALEDVVIRLG